MMERGGYRISEGDEVYGADGDMMGNVVAVEPDYLPDYIVVEQGLLFPTDYYLPVSAIASAADGRVTLNVTKETALAQGWDAAPVDGTDDVGTDADAPATGPVDSTPISDPLRMPVDEEARTATTPARAVDGVPPGPV